MNVRRKLINVKAAPQPNRVLVDKPTRIRFIYYDANLTYESPDNMRWAATTVVDAYVRYRINKKFTAELVGTNLTNRYYMDPFSRSFMPAPGRTFRIGLTGKW